MATKVIVQDVSALASYAGNIKTRFGIKFILFI